MMNAPKNLNLARFWILVCAFLNCAGWILSFIGQLNPKGYLITLGLGLVLWQRFGARVGADFRWGLSPGKLKRRFTRFLPAVFLLIVVLCTLGGILYAPNNYDGLTYRFPRILHWLAEGRWHWIDTSDLRMNYSATGFEWLMVPLLSLTRTDRLFCFINLVSYILLPGLTYATFIRLGVSKRMAWRWMWLLPSGYGFVMQAGSIGNDGFSVVYLLASVCFALKFRETWRARDFWISMIAAALLTGAKASNLPLLLPWALASLPALRLLKIRPLTAAAVLVVSAGCSFVPLAWQNVKYAGDWTGDPHCNMKLTRPLYGVIGNSMQILTQNMAPPVMPFAKAWNDGMRRWIGRPCFQPLIQSFPRLTLTCGELAQEESAGLGLGLSALLAVTVVSGLRRPAAPSRVSGKKLGLLVCSGGWVALLVYMAKMGSESGPRLIAAYYPLIVASVLLLPGVARLARKRWWNIFACLAMFSALPALILTPSRPLWPAASVIEKLSQAAPDNAFVERVQTVYSVYRNRSDILAPVLKHLPPEAKTVGFIGADTPEVSLWRPFTIRRVADITPTNQWDFIKQQGWVVANREGIQCFFGQSLEQWLSTTGGRVIAKENLIAKINKGPQEWYVIQFSGDRSILH